MAISILLLMLINLIVLFLIDLTTTLETVYSESGYISKGMVIPDPSRFNVTDTRLMDRFNYRVNLTIQGEGGLCVIRDLFNEEIVINASQNQRKHFFFEQGFNSFKVIEVNGVFNYTYTILKVTKPLAYLSLFAMIVSIIGFSSSIIYLAYTMWEKFPKKKGGG